MDVVLPREGTAQVLAQADRLEQLMERVSGHLGSGVAAWGQVALPRFQIEAKVELRDALFDLGAGIVFSGAANFSEMLSTPASIDRVTHKTFIEVNESGTEAGATTTIGMIRTSLPPRPAFQFKADRPFLYAIRDVVTGAVLFQGAVFQPSLMR
jgi:serpin B